MKPKAWLGIAAATVVGGAVLENKYDVSGQVAEVSHRVTRALQDPVKRIKNAIKSYPDKDFIERRTDANTRYYKSKGITDQDKLDKIVQTATDYDIAVQLHKEGTLTTQDIIEHISYGKMAIVCLPDVVMTQTWTPTGGKKQRIQRDEIPNPEDMTTSFFFQLKGQDTVIGTFTERPQGGGYYFTLTDKKTGKEIGVFEQAFKVY